ncbi:LysR family transcriptional regulator [Pantoea rwandensis]|uniref:LysR family transcriptional regulator n=1 Tax=Pantoea rwandensis TaxID=1076550 RepID=A0A1X1D638_9GAMM|nr:LysR family transcriptional regulator [Pantoea rwandensis]ORM72097.1 LysR family transcriptional regulator [Pantoea rwandensis]
MQLRALRYFSMVADSTSLREAAEKLFVTPTAVTRQIELLEHFYGASLIERGPRGVKLTREGELLAQAVKATLSELDAVKERISTSQSIVSGTVKISSAESLVTPFIAPVIDEFRALHPKVQFEIETGSALYVAENLISGKADVALTFYMPVNAELQVTNYCELKHKVLMSIDHPLSNKSYVTLKEVSEHPIAIPPSNYAVRQLMETASKREGFTFDIRFTTSSLDVQKRLTMMGLALIIQPQLNVNDVNDHEKLIALPLIDPMMGQVKVELCLPRQRSISLATRIFHEMIARRIESQNY